MGNPDVPRVLDVKQLERIEKLHGGFLYQHLFSAACIVAMRGNGCEHVTVEHDEDVELGFAGERIYVQVKMRGQDLTWTDIRTAMDRFTSIRAAHANGKRPGVASFVVLSNAPPTSALRDRMEHIEWPSDVSIVWPGAGGDPRIPVPQRSIVDLFKSVASEVATIPYRSVATETLVWKLAGLVQHAESGASGHTFERDKLGELFEQLVDAVQRMPLAPQRYYPQEDEPPPLTGDKRRLVTALPGGGKTAWAAQVASYVPGPTAYFDVGDTPARLVGSSLAREVVGQLLPPQSDAFARVFNGAGGGEDAVRRLTAAIHDIPDATVVIDNVQKLEDETIQGLSEALGDVRVVFLARPWRGATVVAARLELERAILGGWSEDTIAEVLADEGIQSAAAAVSAVRRITGGLPLFVKALARLARNDHDGDVAATCRVLETGTNLAESAQEIILDRVVEALTPDHQRAFAALGYAAIGLTRDEAVALLREAGVGQPLNALRRLLSDAVAQPDRYDSVRLHEAFRRLAERSLQLLSEDQSRSLREAFVALLESTIDVFAPAERVRRWLDFIVAGNDADAIANAATDEHLRELGQTEELFARVYRIAEDESEPPATRYVALDARTTRALREGKIGRAVRLMKRLEAMYRKLPARGPRELSTLVSKRMSVLSTKRDVSGIRNAYNTAIRDIVADDLSARLVLFNYAAALFNANAYELAFEAAKRAAGRYMALMSIDNEMLTVEEAVSETVGTAAVIPGRLTRWPSLTRCQRPTCPDRTRTLGCTH